MGFGSNYVTSPVLCFSAEDCIEWMSEHYHNSDDEDDEKINPERSYLPYCDECEKYREFTNNVYSHHRSHRLLVTCNRCRNDFKTFNTKEVGCSVCCH